MQLFTKCITSVIPIRNIAGSVTAYQYISHYKRRTGRGYANDLMHRDLPRFVIANKKNFTRSMARLVGVDSGLEKTVSYFFISIV